MTALSKTKTWTKYSTFIVPGSGPTPQAGQTQANSDGRLLFYRLKTTFLAAGWTVVRSCGYYDDGGGAAWHFGTADHWPDAESVRWKEADNKFGWIVLKNTNLHAVGNGFQVLIALNHDRANTIYGTLSFACEGGYTAGSETVRPTATDEVVLLNDDLWNPDAGVMFENSAVNIWYPSDGTSFRLWWGRSITGTSLSPVWFFERLVDTPAWLDKPVIVLMIKIDLASNVFGQTIGYPGRAYFCCDDLKGLGFALSLEASNAGALINHAACKVPDMGGRWPVFPISAVSTSLLARGYLGRLTDLWAVPSTLAFGDYMPSTGGKEYVVINTLLMPNDGTTIQYP